MILALAGYDTTAAFAGRALAWPYWMKELANENRRTVSRTSI